MSSFDVTFSADVKSSTDVKPSASETPDASARRLIAKALSAQSWVTVDAKSSADLYIINTCTVTREADRQARQEVRRAIRRNPEAMVVVTGCYAQMDPEACAAIPGVDFVVGNDRKLDIHRLLPQLESGELPKVLVGDLDEHVSLPEEILGGFDGQTRAFVQIQQGCDQGCTYCIIHRARGRSRSLPLTLVKRQVERLVMNGYAEIVICGVDLGSWGEDLVEESGIDSQRDDPTAEDLRSTHTLTGLVQELLTLEGNFRIRLSSLDPAHITDELVALMASEDRLCPHIHLSLQSANTLILKRMKRRYTRDVVYERIAALKAAVPHLTLSADVLVGFPTETDEHFDETLTAIDDLKIAWPHVFPYSERPGTPAARIPRQVPVPVRKERAQRVREAGKAVRTRLLAERVGHRMTVLAEGSGDNCVRGRAGDYVSVQLPAREDVTPGNFYEVVPEASDGQTLIAAEVIEPVHFARRP